MDYQKIVDFFKQNPLVAILSALTLIAFVAPGEHGLGIGLRNVALLWVVYAVYVQFVDRKNKPAEEETKNEVTIAPKESTEEKK